MKQTAVEFIVSQLDCLNRQRLEKLIDAETYFKNKKALIKEAKEMQNKQSDDYAIEFLKWCESKSVFSPSVIHKPTYEKLLQQFKNMNNP